jgi:hypothetical protein
LPFNVKEGHVNQQSTTTSSTLQRLAPWAGIAFAVLISAGAILVSDTPESSDKQAWLEFYEDSGNRVSQIIGGYLGIISAFVFLWFSHAIVSRLAAKRDNGDVLTGLARSAATLFAAMLMLAMLVTIAVSAAIEIGDVAEPETGDFGIQFESLAFGILLVASCLCASMFIAAVTELARQEKAWPQWLIWLSYAAAVLLLFGLLFFPVILIPLWTLIVAVVLIVRPESVAEQTP